MKPTAKRTDAEKATIARILMEVGAAAKPRQSAAKIITGSAFEDKHHIAHLRMIAGSRLIAAGFSMDEVSKLFRQQWQTTHAQQQKVHTLRERDRYRQFFNDSDPCPSASICGSSPLP